MKKIREEIEDEIKIAQSDFVTACKVGNTAAVKCLLSNRGIDPDACDGYCLAKAICNNHVNVVKLLLVNPMVDPSARDSYVIRWASEHNHIKIVEALLADPRVDPAACCNQALHIASARNHIDIVKLLLDDKRVNRTDKNNASISVACLKGHVEIVRLLLAPSRHHCCVWGYKRNANGRTKSVKIREERWSIDPSYDDNILIRQACQEGHIEIVEILLKDDRVNPSDRNNSATRLAWVNDHIQVMKILLKDNRIRLFELSNQLFVWACKQKHIDIVRILITDKKFSIRIDRNLTTLSWDNKDIGILAILFGSKHFDFNCLLPRVQHEILESDYIELIRALLAFPVVSEITTNFYFLDRLCVKYGIGRFKLFYFHRVINFGVLAKAQFVSIYGDFSKWKWDHTNFKFYPNIVKDSIKQFLLIAKRNEKHYVLYKDIRLLLIFYIIKSGMEEWLLNRKIYKEEVKK